MKASSKKSEGSNNKALIIVESPTKARTIKNYVGRDFEVRATIGHIKDLPENRLGVDLDRNFEPEFVIIPGKEKVLQEIKRVAKGCKTIYLAPDPDREGEAIAWHISEELGHNGKTIYRSLFNDLSRETILESLRNPVLLDERKFRSQVTRRILDRLVGYQISPILWEKVRQGLSAGRVQSVALRLICERQKEIEAFRPKEYWTLSVMLAAADDNEFEARLHRINGNKPDIKNKEEAERIRESLKGLNFSVINVEEKEKKRNPSPPFTTSKLQQEASRRFHFTAKKTMSIAQQLYEGVEIGEKGPVGLITYMRTDSVKVSPKAMKTLREFIKAQFGEEYLSRRPMQYKSRKGAQEAHEAIRPVDINYVPDKVEPFLTKDQNRLYRLIWEKFVASQMAPAIFNHKIVEISAGPYTFRATDTRMVFDGFQVLYMDTEEEQEDDKRAIPPLKKGDPLNFKEAILKQHFTQPPPPFTESTLIKELEENGIGRPSTYATILSNIRQKEYVEMKKGQFFPTELGMIVSGLLVENFPDIFDVQFTAAMEENLDRIEEGLVDWREVLKEFYVSFRPEFEKAIRAMRNLKKEGIPTEIKCDACGERMVIRVGKIGPFLSCSAFPNCRLSRPYMRNEEGKVIMLKDEKSQGECRRCGRPMVYRKGPYGNFLACSGYPECRETMPISGEQEKKKGAEERLDIHCPTINCTGELLERRTKKGKIFYSCSRYPECRFALWEKPVAKSCPSCGASFMVVKKTKGGETYKCINEECKYSEKVFH